jgi:hypothetical protein
MKIAIGPFHWLCLCVSVWSPVSQAGMKLGMTVFRQRSPVSGLVPAAIPRSAATATVT